MQTCIDPDVFKIGPCKLAGVHTISKSVYAHCIAPYVSKICPCKLAGSQIFRKWRHAAFGDQRKSARRKLKRMICPRRTLLNFFSYACRESHAPPTSQSPL